jgi:hypothetical protein
VLEKAIVGSPCDGEDERRCFLRSRAVTTPMCSCPKFAFMPWKMKEKALAFVLWKTKGKRELR